MSVQNISLDVQLFGEGKKERKKPSCFQSISVALGIYSSSFTFSSCQDLCCCLTDHFFGIYLWGPYSHLNHSPKPLPRTALSACSHGLPATLLTLTGTVTGPPSRDTGSSGTSIRQVLAHLFWLFSGASALF